MTKFTHIVAASVRSRQGFHGRTIYIGIIHMDGKLLKRVNIPSIDGGKDAMFTELEYTFPTREFVREEDGVLMFRVSDEEADKARKNNPQSRFINAG